MVLHDKSSNWDRFDTKRHGAVADLPVLPAVAVGLQPPAASTTAPWPGCVLQLFNLNERNHMTYNATDARLLGIFAQLASSVMQRGLIYSRRDDPHTYASAVRWMERGGSSLELRTRVDPAGEISISGMVCDADGEPVCSVFTLSGSPANPTPEGETPL